MSEPPTTVQQPAQVWPSLQARDARALIDFYVDVFGFLRTAVYVDGDQVAHAQLDWPEGGGIMLGSYRPGVEWSREPGTAGAYLVTDQVQALYERVRAAGATITRPAHQAFWGGYTGNFQDLDGHVWEVAWNPDLKIDDEP
jgi:uncharacterized glyoxalase superfamily protein PhnB